MNSLIKENSINEEWFGLQQTINHIMKNQNEKHYGEQLMIFIIMDFS